MSELSIVSKFSDYYDSECSENNNDLVYNRQRGKYRQRGAALSFIRGIGVKTIDIKTVNSFMFSNADKIVVYTDSMRHNSDGKRVMTPMEASLQYENCVASKFYSDANISVKYLQIGKRRFTVYLKHDNPETLSQGEVINIVEQASGYNRLIGLPIYSIDYIQINNEMVATDFNEIERLRLLNFQSVMSSAEVIEEIKQAMIVYKLNERN